MKKHRPVSYYTENGLISLRKAIRYLEQVPDLKGSQTLKDLQLFSPIIAEFHTKVEMREQGINISGPEQTRLETPDPEILHVLKKTKT